MSFDVDLFEATLRKGLREWGLEDLTGFLPSFTLYAQSIVETNKTLNLTRLVEPEEMAVKNILDSLGLLRLKWADDLTCLDVGTGAGFPGIPLAICRPGWSLVLLDSLRKRLGFLEAVAKDLGLANVTTLHGRAEDVGQDKKHRQKYDLVFSRAVAHLPVLLELTTPMVKVGGCFVAYKSSEAEAELWESTGAMATLGVQKEQMFDMELPLGMGQRCLLVFRKSSPTPPSYPRKAGLPSKKPLK